MSSLRAEAPLPFLSFTRHTGEPRVPQIKVTRSVDGKKSAMRGKEAEKLEFDTSPNASRVNTCDVFTWKGNFFRMNSSTDSDRIVIEC